jgi:DNA-binding protein WhiA
VSSSLSADTKDALAREVPAAPHCREALLRSLALYGTTGERHRIRTQRNAVVRLVRTLLVRASHETPRIEKVPGTRLARTPSYAIALPESLFASNAKPMHKCDRIMEVRGAFLATGSLSAATHGYHLEFVIDGNERAVRLEWMLRALGRAPKTMERKGRSVLYYKDFEAIVDVLTLIGAHGAVLHLEDVRALKETKNRIHRLVNTEAANLERAVAAAAQHRETIEFLSSAYGLQNLTPALREIAELRLRHPDESLIELGRRCNPVIGKPTVNSRLVALGRLAHRLRHPSGSGRKGRREASGKD